MAEKFELYATYLSMVNRSYRVDGGLAESGTNHGGLLVRIDFIDWDSDKETYFSTLKDSFIGVMTEEWDEEHANRFKCRMEDGEFIAERYYKQVDALTFENTDDIDEADEVERYKVDFFFVNTENLLDTLK